MRRFLAAAAGLALAAALLVAHEGHRSLEAKGVRVDGDALALDPRTERAIGLTTVAARTARVEETVGVNAAAALAPGARAFATVRLAGTVAELRVAVGDRVRAGDALAVVESLPLESLAIQWRQAEDDLAAAEADLARAEAVTPRVLPEQELDGLRAAVEDRRIAARSAAGRLLIAGLADADLEAMRKGGPPARTLLVLAPVDGAVAHVDVARGEPVTPERHLFEIHDDRETWVEAAVPEAFSALAETGRAVRVSFETLPGQVFEAPVARVAPEFDRAARALRVSARLDGAPRLRPGTPGRLELVRRSADAVVVPLMSVARQGLEAFVFVRKREGAFERRRVRPGVRVGDEIEAAGVSAGEPVVAGGARQLAALFAPAHLDVTAEARAALDIRTAEADLRPLDEVLSVPATLRPRAGASGVAAPLAGGKVRSIAAWPGDAVAAGAPLAVLESLELREAQADLARAAALVALLESRATSLRDLETKGISARKELLRVESDLRRERLSVQAHQARLIAAGMSPEEIAQVRRERRPLDGIALRAPVAGVVLQTAASLGEVVQAGQPLFRVADVSVLWAEGFVFSEDLSGAPELTGREALVRPAPWPALSWSSRIVGAAPAIGSENALAVWAEVPNRGGELRPGMTADLVLVLRPDAGRVISIPPEALWSSGGDDSVFLETPEGFRRQRVVTGRRGSRFVEIVQGLFPGDRVASAGLDALDRALSSVR